MTDISDSVRTTLPRPSSFAQSPSPDPHDTAQPSVHRLDWRFLLPTFAWSDVAFIGPREHPLAVALRGCSAQVGLGYSPDHSGGGSGQHAVVVCAASDPDAVRHAAACVRPGGHLYVEMAARRTRSWLPTHRIGHSAPTQAMPCSPRRIRRLLVRLGFGTPQLHWHIPNFDTCTYIVPLSDPRPAAYQLRQKWGGGGSYLLMRILLATGVLPGGRACVSLLSQRPAGRP